MMGQDSYLTYSLHTVDGKENSPYLPETFTMDAVKKIIDTRVKEKANIQIDFKTVEDDESIAQEIKETLTGNEYEDGKLKFVVLLMDTRENKGELNPENAQTEEYHFVVFMRCGNCIYLLDPLGFKAKEETETEKSGRKTNRLYFIDTFNELKSAQANLEFFAMIEDIQKDEFNCGSYVCEMVSGLSEKFNSEKDAGRFNQYMKVYFCGPKLEVSSRSLKGNDGGYEYKYSGIHNDLYKKLISGGDIKVGNGDISIQFEWRIQGSTKSIGVLPVELCRLSGSSTYLNESIKIMESRANSFPSPITIIKTEIPIQQQTVTNSRAEIFERTRSGLIEAYSESQIIQQERSSIEELKAIKIHREFSMDPKLQYVGSVIYDRYRREHFKILFGETYKKWTEEQSENEIKSEFVFNKERGIKSVDPRTLPSSAIIVKLIK